MGEIIVKNGGLNRLQFPGTPPKFFQNQRRARLVSIKAVESPLNSQKHQNKGRALSLSEHTLTD